MKKNTKGVGVKQSLSHFLPREPRSINPHDWFYLEPKGLSLIHETMSKNGWVQTDEIVIPWSKIEKALNDFRAAKNN